MHSSKQDSKEHIYLAAQADYNEQALAEKIQTLLEPVTASNLHSTKVLLKPNLLTATNSSLSCTDGRFIIAAARWFLDRGASVQVGDSPSFGSAASVLASMHAFTPLQAMGVRVVEFKKSRQVQLKHGIQVGLAQAALDCDLLVNLPKVKAHGQARLTLAVKNCFGCVAGFQKPWWHMLHGGKDGIFFDLLAGLLAHLPPSIHLVDGIIAMHKTGPMHGKPFQLGCMVCGTNPVAVDTVLLYILQVAAGKSPLWLAARRAGLAGTELDELILDRSRLDALRVDGFRIPGELNPVRFNPLRFLKNNGKRIILRLRGD
ncbi:MAG: DUF362 domain-containing protein [bacterium]|nr:DUF362 domain-containing protein [bacterium]